MTDQRVRLDAPPETLDDDPRARELMTRRLVGISHNAGVDVAVRLLGSATVRHLPTMEGSRCVGLLCEHDLLTDIAERPLHPHSRPATVARLCRQVPSVGPDDRRSTITRAMALAGVDAVLVIDNDKLVGLVTATDVIRSLARESSS
jgi:CBS-domain-containing membrane protein